MCMIKDTVIVGYSGFGKEIFWLLERANQGNELYNFLGYIDKMSNENIVGDDRWICGYSKPLQVVIAIGNPSIRKKLVSQYKRNPNLIFPNIVDPSVKYGSSFQMGEGNIICANNILTVDVKMGNFNILNLNNTIGHGCVIQDFVTINPGCNISGDVKIERDCLVGTGVTILQGNTIGAEAIVGAGAVVINHVAAGTTNVGVPAKEVKK